MLTSWFNDSDLSWMSTWRPTVVLPAYRRGFALHLIVWDGGPEGPLDTPYGRACGRAYALSGQFTDMRVLARTFAGGRGDPYVTLFAEFQTFPCRNNAWAPDASTQAYYEKLKDQYRAALAIFHSEAPNARVSLGWGGWQAAWRFQGRWWEVDVCTLRRRHARIVVPELQSLDSPTAVRDARAMTRALRPYGPVMLAFYKPRAVSGGAVRAADVFPLGLELAAASGRGVVCSELHGYLLSERPAGAAACSFCGEAIGLLHLGPDPLTT